MKKLYDFNRLPIRNKSCNNILQYILVLIVALLAGSCRKGAMYEFNSVAATKALQKAGYELSELKTARLSKEEGRHELGDGLRLEIVDRKKAPIVVVEIDLRNGRISSSPKNRKMERILEEHVTSGGSP